MRGDEFLPWRTTEYSGDRGLGWVDSAASFFHVSMLPTETDSFFLKLGREKQLEIIDLLTKGISDEKLRDLIEDILGKTPEENLCRNAVFIHEFKHFFDILSTPSGLSRLHRILYDNSIFIKAWRNDGKNHVGEAIFKKYDLPHISLENMKRFREILNRSPSVEAWWKACHIHLHRMLVVRDGDVLIPEEYIEKLKSLSPLLPYFCVRLDTEAITANFMAVPGEMGKLSNENRGIEKKIAFTPLGFRQIVEGSALASQLLLLSVKGYEKLYKEYRGKFFRNPEHLGYTACDFLTSKYIPSFYLQDFVYLCDASLICPPVTYEHMDPGTRFVAILLGFSEHKLSTANLRSVVDKIDKENSSLICNLESTLKWIQTRLERSSYPSREYIRHLSDIASKFVSFRLHNNDGLPSLNEIAKGLLTKELILPPVFSFGRNISMPEGTEEYGPSFIRFFASRSIQDDLTYVGKITCPLRKLNVQCEMMRKKCGQWPDEKTLNWPDCFFREVAERFFLLDRI